MKNQVYHSWLLISQVERKLASRERIANFLFLGIAGAIVFYILVSWTDLFYPNNPSGELFMPDVFPYWAAFLFTILQHLPLLFLSASFFFKGKIDTEASLSVRPTDNVARYTAAAFGRLRVLMAWGGTMFLLVLLINLFVSQASCNFFLYVYYFLTLVVPAAVFMIGLAFLIFSWTRNAALGIVLLLAFLATTMNLSGESWVGMLNFTGVNLPGAYSEITGFSDGGLYLLQRAGWLLAGIGMVILSALFDKRPVNRPDEKKSNRRAGGMLVFAGLACLFAIGYSYHEKYAQRNRYAETYNKYSGHKKLYLDRADIEVTPEGKEFGGKARLFLRNGNEERLPRFPLYLNPSLKPVALRVDGREVPYKRENQVIMVEFPVEKGARLQIEIEYIGGIDANVFYLDVPEKEIRSPWTWTAGLAYTGKDYFYLEEEQILLIPEALWYPTSVPPVNPASPYSRETNFTRYTLTVKGAGDKIVLSQGQKETKEGKVIFRNALPQSGISLVAGKYERRHLQVDSIDFELYLYLGHGQLLKTFERETLEKWLRKKLHRAVYYKDFFESAYGKRFPFRHLAFVETPCSFTSYYCHHRYGSELVQPEMVFFPERMPKGWKDNKQMLRARAAMARHNLEDIIKTSEINDVELNVLTPKTISSGVAQPRTWLNKLPAGGVYAKNRIMNPIDLSPLLYRYAIAYATPDYPGLGILMYEMGRKSQRKRFNYEANDLNFLPNKRKAIRLLQERSFGELLQDESIDSELKQRLIHLKVDEAFSMLHRRGVSFNSFHEFWQDYSSRKHFQTHGMADLQVDLEKGLGVDFARIVRDLYHYRELPLFLVKDVHVEKRPRDVSRLSFTIYNDSETDGWVTVAYPYNAFTRGKLIVDMYTHCYHIPAGEGREIVKTARVNFQKAFLDLGISKNHPSLFEFQRVAATRKDTTSREIPVERSVFFPPGEIIVDNTDKGFYATNQQSFVQRWQQTLRANAIDQEDNIQFDHNKTGWQHVHCDAADGFPVHSLVAKMAQNSAQFASWNTTIEKAGNYEIFVYFDPYRRIYPRPSQPFTQYYTIEHGGEKNDVSFQHYGQGVGWISLGKFYFPEGSTKILLHDKGVEGQILTADAVKWKWID